MPPDSEAGLLPPDGAVYRTGILLDQRWRECTEEVVSGNVAMRASAFSGLSGFSWEASRQLRVESGGLRMAESGQKRSFIYFH